MSSGQSMIPIGNEEFPIRILKEYFIEQTIFISNNLPVGRYPTTNELREAILGLGLNLEELEKDWLVSAENDATTIWFTENKKNNNMPVEISFRGGGPIILDIAQALSNRCGSFFVVAHSGSYGIIILSDDVFPVSSQTDVPIGYVATISQRLPIMLDNLKKASTEETLFIMSQIRQARLFAKTFNLYEFSDRINQGIEEYNRLLNHKNANIRFLAFDLIIMYQIGYRESIKTSLIKEGDVDTKVQMIDAIEKMIYPEWAGSKLSHWTKSILDHLLELGKENTESPQVRLAATNLLALKQPGLITDEMQKLFEETLTDTKKYQPNWSSSNYNYIVDKTLKSIGNLPLINRIDILLSGLYKMTNPQDAHTVLRDLLDHVFFGAAHPTSLSSLPDEKTAERPEIDEELTNGKRLGNWLYPVNPNKLTFQELLPFQQNVLESVIDLDIPWLVHSNILEKYGLPPTRNLLRVLLNEKD